MRHLVLLLLLAGCGGGGLCDACRSDDDCGGVTGEEGGACAAGYCCRVSGSTCGVVELRVQCPALFDGDPGNGEVAGR